jgi:aminoglycoside/choline kinase family phosphotransferase
MNSERDAALERLLMRTGFADAERRPLAVDASTRRYERLILPDRTAVLMDAPRSAESGPCPPGATAAERRALGWNAMSRLAASRVEAYAAVAQWLSRVGLSAPQVHGVEIEAGYAVIEDLGDGLYSRAIGQGADEIELYAAAAEVLARVHSEPAPSELGGPGAAWPLLDYDTLALEVNMDLFVDWLPQASDVRVSDALRVRWERARDELIAQALAFPRAFTIRDYHADNLLWLPARTGPRRVGLLDFQDAVRGWRAWDFAMLLHDARRDVSEAAAETSVATYLRLTGAPEAPFRHELSVLGAINALRILGIFSRLVARDGKPRYRDFMPREWGHLARTLRHPAAAAMADFVQEVAGDHVQAAA